MPRGDGTGPTGKGPGTGRGMRGKGQKRQSGQMGRPGMGPGGNCVCPSCGERVPHQPGTPCTEISCPKCSTAMVRE
ncbi:MAG: hypothetical protein R6U89_04715 [Dehalococcoidia bacterium]